jgi:hypothetical protein
MGACLHPRKSAHALQSIALAYPTTSSCNDPMFLCIAIAFVEIGALRFNRVASVSTGCALRGWHPQPRRAGYGSAGLIE